MPKMEVELVHLKNAVPFNLKNLLLMVNSV